VHAHRPHTRLRGQRTRDGGREIATIILGAYGELTRYGDYSRIASWVQGPSAPAEPVLVGASEPAGTLGVGAGGE
jgi:hypothetical protein